MSGPQDYNEEMWDEPESAEVEPVDQDKQAKKLAKAAEKAAKKQAAAEAKAKAAESNAEGESKSDDSLAQRSLEAAEKKVKLETWRTVFAALGALVGIGTLALMLRGGC